LLLRDQTHTNKSINDVLTKKKSINDVKKIYYFIYTNFRQPNLFKVAQYLLFRVAKYKYILTNSRIIISLARVNPSY